MEPARVTHKEIAHLAGVHRATVSLALKGHPSIPPETRDRIRKIAEKLGYTPDPMLSALAAYRLRQGPSSFHGTLGWLANSRPDWTWRSQVVFCEYYEGAVARAKKHGYNIEVFDLGERGMTPARMSGILQSRNISGLLVCPQPAPDTELDFEWDKFSAVTFGYTLVRPQLHTIAATQYRLMLRLVHKLREMGYRRLGMAYGPQFNERTDFNYLAGWMVEQHLAKSKINIPFLERACIGMPDAFSKWFRRYKPEVVISPDVKILEILRQCGLKAPDDVSVACLCVPSQDTVLSGMCENPQHIGAVGVDFLVAMINRGERGIPEIQQRLHVEAIWKPGRTLARN